MEILKEQHAVGERQRYYSHVQCPQNPSIAKEENWSL
jgi:hypothetical protein